MADNLVDKISLENFRTEFNRLTTQLTLLNNSIQTLIVNIQALNNKEKK